LKSFDSARDFIEAWPLHYNFFRPHEVTNHTTPAYRAGIRSPLKIKLP
jgi:transposase InsO family protein